ncbi:MAG: A/G-specific adenine glycosylase [Burkholderiales bacterium]|nr:A/G-specific adenine glycosylase [Burkholderiales bacterium]
MSSFGERIIDWQRDFGRHDLPWQRPERGRDPYAIWLSEIMLQQTRVAAVSPYYRRFIERFPDVASLAAAPLDDALALWAGLGYYARARNLHRAAQAIVEQHGGIFPREFDIVAQLPGIGRSTAAAICAFSYGQRHPILDGNVKRVLARYRGIAGYPRDKNIQVALWQAAENLLPERDIERYTQGLMDLGATVCTRTRPACCVCPLHKDCIARRQGRSAELPGAKPKKQLPQRQTAMIILSRGDQLLLERRPPIGIWGGLWSFPEMLLIDDADAARERCEQRFAAQLEALPALPDIAYGFTHFQLRITPLRFRVSSWIARAAEPDQQWLSAPAARLAAIPAPVARLLDLLS